MKTSPKLEGQKLTLVYIKFKWSKRPSKISVQFSRIGYSLFESLSIYPFLDLDFISQI